MNKMTYITDRIVKNTSDNVFAPPQSMEMEVKKSEKNVKAYKPFKNRVEHYSQTVAKQFT